MLQQIKGAMKLFFMINLMIAALNIWVMKDNRHISFYVTDASNEAVIMEKQALAAYGEMN
jgi:hypothetical protein